MSRACGGAWRLLIKKGDGRQPAGWPGRFARKHYEGFFWYDGLLLAQRDSPQSDTDKFCRSLLRAQTYSPQSNMSENAERLRRELRRDLTLFLRMQSRRDVTESCAAILTCDDA